VELKQYVAGKDFDYLKKYGMISKGTMINPQVPPGRDTAPHALHYGKRLAYYHQCWTVCFNTLRQDNRAGVRVFIDAEKLELWPTIKNWYFKLAPKRQEDAEFLINNIREAGAAILGLRPVIVPQIVMDKRHRGTFTICPRCHESYPATDSLICRACQGELIYVESGEEKEVVLNQGCS
jgi:hypothetical protein